MPLPDAILLFVLIGAAGALWAGRAYRRGFTAGVRFGRDIAEEKAEMNIRLAAWMREEEERRQAAGSGEE